MERLKREHVALLDRLDETQPISELYDAFLIFEISRINGEWVTVIPLDPFTEIVPGYNPEKDKPLYFTARITETGHTIREKVKA